MGATTLIGIMSFVTIVIALLSWLVAIYSYLKMMTEISPGVDVAALCRHYEIKSNLLFITRPDIFTIKGMVYRRWYIRSLAVFISAVGIGMVSFTS
jgi:hypothetical protein